MVWQTLLICLFTVWWAVSHYSGHMGRSGASPEFCYSLLSFTDCMTEYVNHAYWKERRLHVDSSAFGRSGRMVWEKASTAAQMLPFKCLVDSTLPLLLSKSGVIVCHKVRPFASTTALSLDHAPEMKGQLGYIWNRAAITYIFFVRMLCWMWNCIKFSCSCSAHWRVWNQTVPICLFYAPVVSVTELYWTLP